MAVSGQGGSSAGCFERAKELRDKEFSWSQIVDVLALLVTDEQAGPLRFYRCAHGRSASSVVDEFNQLDPAGSATLRVQRLYDYEMWPKRGRRPSTRVLSALARIYQTEARRLVSDSTYASYTTADRRRIDAADFSHLDRYQSPRRMSATATPGTSSELLAGDGTADGALGEAGLGPPALVGRQGLSAGADPFESTELLRVVTRIEPDRRRRELLFQLALLFGGVSGLPLVQQLDPDERERLAAALSPGWQVCPQAVATCENLVRLSRRLYEDRGPEAVLRAVMQFRTAVVGMFGDLCGAGLRQRLLRVYAELSQLGGWMLYDLTRYPEADRCFREGLAAAQEVRDIPMMAFIHCSLSQMGSFRGQVPTAIDHAFAARGWAGGSGSARLASYTEAIGAWAFSLDKNRALTTRALSRAEQLLPDRTSEDDPEFVRFVDRGFTVGFQAHCWLRLGQPKPALRAAEDGFALTDPTFERNRGFRLVDVAKALVLQGEVEEGARLTEQVAEIAAGHKSVRLARWVGEARNLMSPWAATPQVRRLDERLVTLGIAS